MEQRVKVETTEKTEREKVQDWEINQLILEKKRLEEALRGHGKNRKKFPGMLTGSSLSLKWKDTHKKSNEAEDEVTLKELQMKNNQLRDHMGKFKEGVTQLDEALKDG